MQTRSILIAGLAAIALTACGDKDRTRGTSPGAAARVEAPSPLDKPVRIKGAEETDVDALFALFPNAVRPVYEEAHFDSKTGATVITGLRFIDHDPDDQVDFEGLSIERAELYGVDMEAIDRVTAAAGADAEAPFETLFAKVRLYGVAPTRRQSSGAAAVGAIEVDQFRLRQGGFRDADDMNAADFFNAFALAGLYMKDVKGAEASGEGDEFKFSIPDLRLVGFGGGKIDAVIAKDLEYELRQGAAARAALAQAMGGPAGVILAGPLKGFVAPDHQRATVKSFEWRKIDLSGLMEYGLRHEEPPTSARDLINLGKIRALDAETFIGGKRAAKVKETTINAMEFTWLAPSNIRSMTKGAEYDFTAYLSGEEAEAIDVLKSHGLESVKGEGQMSWDWDADEGGARFATDFTTTNLADFDMELDLAGLELEKIREGAEEYGEDAVLSAAKFVGFGVTMTDKNLLDAMFDMAALEMGGSGGNLRQSTPAMIRLTGLEASLVNERIGDYVNAVADFIAEGGRLEISAKPKDPVAADVLANGASPETLPDLIDLRVVHTKPEK